MRVEPSGPVPCDLALFGDTPKFEEAQQGTPFVGRAGQQLWADMRRIVGLKRGDVYLSHIVKDALPKGREPKPAEIAHAMPEVLDELDAVRPRVILTAGGVATRAILGPGVYLSNVHGIPHTVEIAGRAYTCFPMYHPAAGMASKGMLACFSYDLDGLKRFLRGDLRPWAPSQLPAWTSWLLTTDCKDLGRLKAGHVVAVDTEGWKDKPWGLSFSANGQNGWVIRADDPYSLTWFQRWIQNKVVVCHNGLHDVPVLRAMGVRVTPAHDTQVLAYHDMLRSGSGALEAEAQNLGTLAYRETQLLLGELSAISGVDLASQVIPYTDAVMHYAALDPIATWRLFQVYRERGLTDYAPYQIDMGQVPLVGDMIDNGIPFDQDEALDYHIEVLGKIDDATATLKAKAARYGNREFNPKSHPQVRELITRKIGLKIRKRTKGGQASTNEKALADHKDDPFVSALQTHRELTKLESTYTGPLLEALQ